MHENGQRIETRQYRNDSNGEELLVHSAEVEYYSFLQAGFHLVTNNDSVTIQVGGGVSSCKTIQPQRCGLLLVMAACCEL